MMRKCLLLFLLLLGSALLAKPLSCAIDTIEIPLAAGKSKPTVRQNTHQVTLTIPASVFKGIDHLQLHFIQQVQIKKIKNAWQINFHANRPISLKVSYPKLAVKLRLSDKTCAQGKNGKKVVVIDPGHGGKDPGAISASNIKEKDITLAIAKKIKKTLEKNPKIIVKLTRSKDEFIPLRKRITLASTYNPDLFISIHADSAPRKTASGLSVYALSAAGATSEMARWLADHNNQKTASESEQVGDILFQLTQTATILSSLDLGSQILSQVNKPLNLHIDHVEQAGFVVLKAFDVPSVLIETGFVSNAHEAKLLHSSAHQQKVASAIAKGVQSYLFATEPTPTQVSVQVGDTLIKIAKRYHTTVDKIIALNPSIKPHLLRKGQKIILPGSHS